MEGGGLNQETDLGRAGCSGSLRGEDRELWDVWDECRARFMSA
jgi:hypothetical protein